jgi:site-specific recombinase XerD
MEITRFLRKDQLRKDGTAQISVLVCWNNQRVRFAVKGANVKPADWDDAAGKVRGRVKFASDINAKLDAYEYGLKQFSYEQERQGYAPDAESIKAEANRIKLALSGDQPAAKSGAPIRLPEFWLQFQKDHRGVKSESYIKHFTPVLTHLKAFSPKVDFKDITLSFANQFLQYLMDRGLSDDSAFGALKKLRAVMKYAKKNKIRVPEDYEDFPARSSHIEREFLTEEELTRLEQTIMVDGFYMRQRDVFLFACYTGLRWSDLPQVKPGKIAKLGQETTVIKIIQTKTGQANPIPLSDLAKRIIDKYPDGLPLVAQQVYNRALKEICKLAGLTRAVTISRMYAGKRVDVEKSLWQIVSSHTARHTFATLSLQRGMHVTNVQGLLGHGSISSTMIYTHNNLDDKVKAVRDAWNKKPSEN